MGLIMGNIGKPAKPLADLFQSRKFLFVFLPWLFFLILLIINKIIITKGYYSRCCYYGNGRSGYVVVNLHFFPSFGLSNRDQSRYSPVGIASLIAAKILEIDDLARTAKVSSRLTIRKFNILFIDACTVYVHGE